MVKSNQPFEVNQIEGLLSEPLKDEHFKNEDKVDRWFNEMDQQVDFMSYIHLQPSPEPLDKEVTSQLQPLIEELPK